MAAVIFAVGLVAAPASAQSYDCRKGGLNPTERTICQYHDLSEQDIYLNDLWGSLTQAERNTLRGEQVAWLRDRDWCGRDAPCIADAYELRIEQLLYILEGPGGINGTAAESYGGNVRARADINSNWLATLSQGEPVTLLEDTGIYFNGYPWFWIEYGTGQTGYHWGGIICDYDGNTPGLGGICAGYGQPPLPPHGGPPIDVPSDYGVVASWGAEVEVTQFYLDNDSTSHIQVFWIDGNSNYAYTSGAAWIAPGGTWSVDNGAMTWESHWYAIHDSNGFVCSFSPRQWAEVFLSELVACAL